LAWTDLGGGEGWMDLVVSHPLFAETNEYMKCYGNIKGKLSGKVPHCNFYFVAFLVHAVPVFL